MRKKAGPFAVKVKEAMMPMTSRNNKTNRYSSVLIPEAKESQSTAASSAVKQPERDCKSLKDNMTQYRDKISAL